MASEPEFLDLVRPQTGAVAEIIPTTYGFSSDLTAIVVCERGPFFVKAMRNKPGGRRDSIVRERLVNPFVRSIAPALRWQVKDEGWIVLGFEVVEGRPADFTPGSPDLSVATRLINSLADLPLPAVARDWPETRWDRFARSAEEAELFRGDALLHTDINPDNVLVGDRKGWLVDWSWPTRGAALIDPACLVLQLVGAGHSAESAESWAARCPSWTTADPRAIDAFALANVRMYCAFRKRRPDADWLAAMVAAARAWADHRGLPIESAT